MKKLTLAALIALLTFTFCNKQYSGHYQNLRSADSTQALIDSAHAFMNQHEPAAPPMLDSTPYARTALHKTPIWSQARVQSFSFGRGVVVPLNIAEPLSIRVGAGQVPVSASQITWLLLYQDTARRWHPEVITRLVDDTATILFQGEIRVEDWQGNFIKAYRFKADTLVTYTQSSFFLRPGGTASIVAPAESAPTTPIGSTTCTETDWYGCATIGDGPTQCQYVYTSEDCLGNFSAPEEIPYGVPTPPDYSTVGGGTAPAATPVAANITPDTSVLNNPIVACVYNHLMSPLLTNGLKSILSSFDDNTYYNVNFTVSMGEDTADGVCSYRGNNTFLITLNGNNADDPDYSRIYLASAMIHEAFHAKLRQRALEKFGEATIAQWPTPIDDMTLSELASYYEADAKANNIWEATEHDWMVNNIAQLATSLEQFVQTFYPTTYAAVGSSIVPYEALMYAGLQNSTLYQEQVVAQGLQTSFQQYAGELNEGGKCSD